MTIKLNSGKQFRVRTVLSESECVILENLDTGKYRQLEQTDYHKILHVYK